MTAPDADRPTTHIRCGSDIRLKLAEAGFEGAFLEISDPFCQGPVPDTSDWIAIRARFVAQAYGTVEGTARLPDQHAALAVAAQSDHRLVLWYEHDSYDQLSLAYVLHRLAGRPDVDLICIADHPRLAAESRFIGLGQLTASELADLFPTRVPVDRAQTQLATATWQALRSPTPLPLYAIAGTATQAILPLAPALLRHLQDLPWDRDGLALTERLILRAVAGGASTIGRVFGAAQALDPLPFLGDLMILPIVEALAATGTPALTIGPAAHWAQRIVALTRLGQALLDGDADWQHAMPPERWLGGIRITPASWRWSRTGPVLPKG